MDQNQAQNWGLAITPRIEVNHIGGQILASHLLRQGYGIVDCNQMCYLEVMELTGYHFPRTARDAEAGWVVIGLRAITIRCLMVYFLIMIAHQIVLRHLGGGPHQYKNSKWARWLVLQLEVIFSILFSGYSNFLQVVFWMLIMRMIKHLFSLRLECIDFECPFNFMRQFSYDYSSCSYASVKRGPLFLCCI